MMSIVMKHVNYINLFALGHGNFNPDIRDRSLNMGGAEDFVKFSSKKRVAPPSNFAKNSVAPPSDLAKK